MRSSLLVYSVLCAKITVFHNALIKDRTDQNRNNEVSTRTFLPFVCTVSLAELSYSGFGTSVPRCRGVTVHVRSHQQDPEVIAVCISPRNRQSWFQLC